MSCQGHQNWINADANFELVQTEILEPVLHLLGKLEQHDSTHTTEPRIACIVQRKIPAYGAAHENRINTYTVIAMVHTRVLSSAERCKTKLL